MWKDNNFAKTNILGGPSINVSHENRNLKLSPFPEWGTDFKNKTLLTLRISYAVMPSSSSMYLLLCENLTSGQNY